jgi:uncharacterized membrane protein YphA (DoxX/SURF4 family)
MTDNLLHTPAAAMLAAANQNETLALAVIAAVAVALYIWTRLKKDSIASVGLALLVLRLAIGICFLVLGWGKVSGEIHSGFGTFANQASASIPSWMPHGLGRAYLYCVPWAEVLVGACLIAGFMTRGIGLIATLMLVSFSIAVTGLSNPPMPLHSNVLLIAIAIALMLLGAGHLSVDSIMLGGKKKKSH